MDNEGCTQVFRNTAIDLFSIHNTYAAMHHAIYMAYTIQLSYKPCSPVPSLETGNRELTQLCRLYLYTSIDHIMSKLSRCTRLCINSG